MVTEPQVNSICEYSKGHEKALSPTIFPPPPSALDVVSAGFLNIKVSEGGMADV